MRQARDRHGHQLIKWQTSSASVRGRKEKVTKEQRLLFRTPFFVHASILDALKKPTFPGTLDLVGGHVALYGWFLAMLEALDAGGPAADEWVWALWQAGLTASIHAQIVTSPTRQRSR